MMMVVVLVVVYGPLLNDANEAETAFPKFMLPAASLHPKYLIYYLYKLLFEYCYGLLMKLRLRL